MKISESYIFVRAWAYRRYKQLLVVNIRRNVNIYQVKKDLGPITQYTSADRRRTREANDMTSATLIGALVTASFLGITHGIEPDHVAGISSLAGEAGGTRLSAVVGACFSLGHVVLVVVWLGFIVFFSGLDTFPHGLDRFGTVGAALLLAGLGTVMVGGGLRVVVQTDEHSHGSVTHEHSHMHLPLTGVDHHSHEVSSYLKTGLLGALFTLSPPLSMIAFASTLFPEYSLGAVGLAVAVYAVSITFTMSAIGAGVGAVFETTRSLDARAYGAIRTVAGIAILSLAVVMLSSTLPVV